MVSTPLLPGLFLSPFFTRQATPGLVGVFLSFVPPLSKLCSRVNGGRRLWGGGGGGERAWPCSRALFKNIRQETKGDLHMESSGHLAAPGPAMSRQCSVTGTPGLCERQRRRLGSVRAPRGGSVGAGAAAPAGDAPEPLTRASHRLRLGRCRVSRRGEAPRTRTRGPGTGCWGELGVCRRVPRARVRTFVRGRQERGAERWLWLEGWVWVW